MINVVKLMINSKAHRVVIQDENGHPLNLITQSRIVDLLSCVVDSIPNASKTVKELKLGVNKEVISVDQSATARKAFELMREKVK